MRFGKLFEISSLMFGISNCSSSKRSISLIDFQFLYFLNKIQDPLTDFRTGDKLDYCCTPQHQNGHNFMDPSGWEHRFYHSNKPSFFLKRPYIHLESKRRRFFLKAMEDQTFQFLIEALIRLTIKLTAFVSVFTGGPIDRNGRQLMSALNFEFI